MSQSRRSLAGALAAMALAGTGWPAAPAAAAPPYRLAAVALSGGPGWRAVNEFTVTWDLVPAPPAGVTPRLEFQVEDEGGAAIGPVAATSARTRVLNLAIPAPPGQQPPPGAYRLALWLAEAGRATAQIVILPLDNRRPEPVRPSAPSGWLAAGTSVRLTIAHPGWPRPASGIRGYAVELDHGSGAAPCGQGLVCPPQEIDLGGGEDDDSIVLGPLAEGVNVARVVAVSGTGVPSAPAGEAVLHVDGTPPALELRGVPAGWARGAVEVEALASDPLSGMLGAGPGGPLTALSLDGGPATVVPGARARATVHGDGPHLLLARARDAVGNLGAADPAAARAVVWIDETPPRVSFEPARDPAAPERIVAVVADALSGPSARRGGVAIRPAGSSRPFEPLPTSVQAGRLVTEWDSDAFPRGSYELRATGYDAAGNRAETPPGTLVLTNPVKRPTTLAFGFGGRRYVEHRCSRRPAGMRCHRRVLVDFSRRPAARTVAYGRGVPVAGRLTDAAGAPLAGEPVTIVETFAAGAEPARRTSTATTGADGVFLAHLDPGPSRRVEAVFAGSPTLTAAAGPGLRLGARAAVRLRASGASAVIGGRPIVFSGHIGRRGAALPVGGLPVALEFRVAALPWTEFRTVQTDGHGGFRFPYAFSDDDSRGVRFQFRAHLAAQPGWPYAAAYSRPVTVTGR
ncbi:MAG: carboxypeptidase-like regulatory domain-containing protein [Solirubrobacterales bacterium]